MMIQTSPSSRQWWRCPFAKNERKVCADICKAHCILSEEKRKKCEHWNTLIHSQSQLESA